MQNKNIGIFINDNLLSTMLIKKIIKDNRLNIKFIIIENIKKKKNYLFFFLFLKDLLKILLLKIELILKNENIETLCKKNDIDFFKIKNVNNINLKKFLKKNFIKNIFLININKKLNINENYNNINFINIHLGDVKKYKGVFCLIHSIINKEKYFHISSHHISSDYDLGDIIFQKKIKIYRGSLFNLYQYLFYKKIDIIHKTLELVEKSKFLKNNNNSKMYKPPTFTELLKFFRTYKKYELK
jgi:hypothetical protein